MSLKEKYLKTKEIFEEMNKKYLLHHVGMLESTFEKLLRTYENVYILNNISKDEWIKELKFIEENWENTFTPNMNFNYKLRAFAKRLLEMSEKYINGKRELINNTIRYMGHFPKPFWGFTWGEDDWRIEPTRTVTEYFGWEIHPYYHDIVGKKFSFLKDISDFQTQNYAKINHHTLLIYRNEPGSEKYKLGNIEFSHGVITGYNHNGIQDSPYTKESLKFLVKEI